MEKLNKSIMNKLKIKTSEYKQDTKMIFTNTAKNYSEDKHHIDTSPVMHKLNEDTPSGPKLSPGL